MSGAGRLIVLEGLDGSGKATQTQRLLAWLLDRGERAAQVSFPDYGSDASALVRMYLAGGMGNAADVNPYAASSFYAADRYVSFQLKWKSLYLDGYTIVSDRYTTSNAVHQMSKLPREQWDDYLQWLDDYEYRRLALPRPDRVVYLDMHPDTSRTLLMDRAAAKGAALDAHERDAAYLRHCRTAALYAAERLGWRVVRCCDGAKPDSVEAIFDRITEQLLDNQST